MSRPLHVAGFCLSVARAADVISQRISDLKGVRIDVRFLQRRGVQIHIGAASIILNEAEAAAKSTTAATVIELRRRGAPSAALPPPVSAQELLEAMATLDENSRQIVIDYMDSLLAKRSR
jgi:hypothetical protein